MNGAQGEKNGGVPIVLTASKIEMSDFKLNPFVAFTGGFPSKIVPLNTLRTKWYPETPDNPDGTAQFAPYGLRKIETLLGAAFGGENVVVCRSDNLSKFVGPGTKVIGISTMDPLGVGFVSRTYTSILGLSGIPMAAREFSLMMEEPVLKEHRQKIVVGGAGAWQIEKAGMIDALGIDYVVMGEGERSIVGIFKKLLGEDELPRYIKTEKPAMEEVPVVKNASLYGVVEITRGCGRNCKFCSPTMRKLTSFPLEHILAEARVNASQGSKMITLQTDDVFLYKRKRDFVPNREEIVKLLRAVDEIPGVDYIQIAHAALAPVALDKKMIEEIGPILVEKGRWKLANGKKYASVEVGLETGSTALMEKYMKWKMHPYKPHEWQDVVVDAIGIMNDSGIYPLGTLLTGLPGETESDTRSTLEMIERIGDSKIFYVPLLFTAEDECLLGKEKNAEIRNITELQWEFLSRCWEHNIDIFTRDRSRVLIAFFSMMMYPYFRVQHGNRILRPMMRFAGLDKAVDVDRVGRGALFQAF